MTCSQIEIITRQQTPFTQIHIYTGICGTQKVLKALILPNTQRSYNGKSDPFPRCCQVTLGTECQMQFRGKWCHNWCAMEHPLRCHLQEGAAGYHGFIYILYLSYFPFIILFDLVSIFGCYLHSCYLFQHTCLSCLNQLSSSYPTSCIAVGWRLG